MPKPKIVLGLSGGVDSAVAARLLMERYEVIALYLSIGPEGAAGEVDARRVAAQLGMEFRVMDISDALERHVKAPFAAAYLSGKTPLPCAVCNPLVKFPSLLALADEVGAEHVATGHYARVEMEEGRAVLKKGPASNDQSYMLARLPQDILRRVVFPLGDLPDKEAVRALAAQFGIPVAEKPDSMEICFIPDNDYAGWLDRRGASAPPGDFVAPDGTVLGRHKGIHHYTVGQGRGLGVSGPHRYYVSAIDPVSDRVTLSDGSDLTAHRVFCTDPNWVAIPGLTAPMAVTARFRHARTETPCTLVPTASGVTAEVPAGVRAPTPGQLTVFYDGDAVVGSAWIEDKE